MTLLIIYCIVCYVVALIATCYLISGEYHHYAMELLFGFAFAPLFIPFFILFKLGEWIRKKTEK